MRQFLFVFLAPLFAGAFFCHAADLESLPPKEKFQLFLLVGQSNMAGRGVVADDDRTPDPRVLMLNKAGEWVPAIDPMHFDKPIAGVGLGRSFARVVADANPGVTIGLIPCAVGGTPIDSWRPGASYEPTKSHPWDDALRRTKLALRSGELKGILWHQGESDSNAELAPSYEAKLHDFIQRLRTELVAPQVPFVVGQMGKFADKPWDEYREIVNKAHQDLPGKVARTAFVPSTGLKHKGDKVHFDSASYRKLGERYAAAYLQLVRGAAGDRTPPAQAPRPRLQVINGSTQPVDVFWLKSETERVPNGTVAPADWAAVPPIRSARAARKIYWASPAIRMRPRTFSSTSSRTISTCAAWPMWIRRLTGDSKPPTRRR